MGIARVDTEAVRVAAQRFSGAADILDRAVRTQLGGLRFDGATAGREYTACGDALRSALIRLVAEVTQWSRSTAEIAAALYEGSNSYAEAEYRAAARVR